MKLKSLCSDSHRETELIIIIITITITGCSQEVFSNQRAAGKQRPQLREEPTERLRI